MGKQSSTTVDGILALDKPIGLSSNQALQITKKILNVSKAGHAGTLDPFATGLLICCLGTATKLSETVMMAQKDYHATLMFGAETDSGDLTGKVIAWKEENTDIDTVTLRKVLLKFCGVIGQIPPMYSALKYKGKPLYEYARSGIEVKRSMRYVTVHRIDLVSYLGNQAEITVTCSKGTYVRTLAQDIGRALGNYAHLRALRRTRIGEFNIKKSVTLDILQSMPNPREAIITLNDLPSKIKTQN